MPWTGEGSGEGTLRSEEYFEVALMALDAWVEKGKRHWTHVSALCTGTKHLLCGMRSSGGEDDTPPLGRGRQEELGWESGWPHHQGCALRTAVHSRSVPVFRLE